MLFMQLDQGAVVRKETGRDVPRIVRLLIGNPLIMKEMAKPVPSAGSYAPVTVLVDERSDGVHLSYDRMTSLLAPYEDRDALEVAHDLDSKIEGSYGAQRPKATTKAELATGSCDSGTWNPAKGSAIRKQK